MKKIIPLVFISLLLVAATSYGNDYRHWNLTGTYEKKAKCLWMIKGYLSAVETIKMLMVSLESRRAEEASLPWISLKTAEEYLLEQIPDLCMEDYAKIIMLQIELFYMQGKFREASFSTVFAAAVIEIANKMPE